MQPKSFYDKGVFQQHQVWESPELLLLPSQCGMLWRAEVNIIWIGTSCGLALLHACRFLASVMAASQTNLCDHLAATAVIMVM